MPLDIAPPRQQTTTAEPHYLVLRQKSRHVT